MSVDDVAIDEVQSFEVDGGFPEPDVKKVGESEMEMDDGSRLSFGMAVWSTGVGPRKVSSCSFAFPSSRWSPPSLLVFLMSSSSS